MKTKKTLLLNLLALAFFFKTNAQTKYQILIDSMYAYDAHKVVNGTGYVFGGVSQHPLTGPTNRNSYVVRTDLLGNTLWTISWVGNTGWAGCYGQYQNDLCPMSDGGVISCGGGSGICSDTTTGGNIARIDGNGNIKWAKYCSISSDPYPCIQSSDGNIVFGGYISGGGYKTPKDAFITKLDSANGDTIWSKRYGGAGNVDWFYHILQTADGGYLAAGKTNSFGQGGLDIYLVKTDANGNLMWSKTYGTATLDEIAFGHCLQPTSDGGYILTGTGGGGSGGTGSQSAQGIFLLKIDALGNMKWSKYYAGQEAHGVKQTPDKGYIFSGDAYVGPPLYQGDVILVKTDSTGTIQWSKSYGSTSDEQGLILESANDGGFVVGGTSRGFVGTGGLYIIKTDSNGNSGCNESNLTIASSAAPFIMANAATQVSKGTNTISYPTIFTRVGATTTLCATAEINHLTVEKNNQLTVYPNPSNEQITIRSTTEIGLITIYNLLGEIALQVKNNNVQAQIDISKLATGVYIIEVNGKYVKLNKE
ncbi:MAG TPA: T9SS type A sorting domain-containing protein [Bacteroidia bacterium]|jgi:hypothetical protein|nr:T9SS type A sorting domain-containing protein [Bacteroidia bacterium]